MSIIFKLKDKPKHPIVMAIKKYEPDMYNENDLIIYSPHFDSTSGWTINGHFLGFTIMEVIETYKRHNI